MYLHAFCISSLVKCLFKSSTLLKKKIVFCMLRFKRFGFYLNIFYKKIFMYLENILSQFYSLSFHSLQQQLFQSSF